jgi:hypothetical protein
MVFDRTRFPSEGERGSDLRPRISYPLQVAVNLSLSPCPAPATSGSDECSSSERWDENVPYTQNVNDNTVD